jgi:hypothetical protein
MSGSAQNPVRRPDHSEPLVFRMRQRMKTASPHRAGVVECEHRLLHFGAQRGRAARGVVVRGGVQVVEDAPRHPVTQHVRSHHVHGVRGIRRRGVRQPIESPRCALRDRQRPVVGPRVMVERVHGRMRRQDPHFHAVGRVARPASHLPHAMRDVVRVVREAEVDLAGQELLASTRPPRRGPRPPLRRPATVRRRTAASGPARAGTTRRHLRTGCRIRVRRCSSRRR